VFIVFEIFDFLLPHSQQNCYRQVNIVSVAVNILLVLYHVW